jgi:phosphoribosylformimino-5-aminoimidazole carboxamide ribotide isomerase
MLVIPAVDIRQGNCVMLKQGKIEDETVYSKDPAFIARLWQAKGARRIHVVDLDGAFNGMPQNLEVIKNIRATVDIPMEVGGGVRSLKTIDSLIEIGANYVIVGTLAVYNPDIIRQAVEKHGSRIIVAIDARDGKVAIGGWKDTTPVDALELTQKMREMGVEEIIYTDITKDGMLEGPNLEGLKAIASKSGMKVIASGGVTTLEDIKNVKALEANGVVGAIVGKALYTEDMKLEDAIKIAEKE